MIDNYYNDTVLFLPMFGENGAVDFTDLSVAGETVTVDGGAQKVTSQYKYYGSCGYFDDIDSRLSVDGAVLADCGATFTVEAWIRLDSWDSPIIGQGDNAANEDQFFKVSPSGYLQYHRASALANPITLTGSTQLSLDTWYHVALVCDGTNAKIYLDGVQDATTAHTGSWVDTVQPLYIGYHVVINFEANEDYYGGYIQDLRITDVARYTTTFTPPGLLYVPYDGDMTLPALTSSGFAANGTTNDGDVTFPPLSTTYTYGDVTAPSFVVTGQVNDIWNADITLPTMTVNGSLSKGFNGKIALPELDATGQLSGWTGQADLTLPNLEATGDFLPGTLSAGVVSLPRFKISGRILSGVVTDGEVEIPAMTCSGSLYADTDSDADLTLPSLVCFGSIRQELTDIILRYAR